MSTTNEPDAKEIASRVRRSILLGDTLESALDRELRASRPPVPPDLPAEDPGQQLDSRELLLGQDGSLKGCGNVALEQLAVHAGRWQVLRTSPDLIVLSRLDRSGGQPRVPIALSGEIDALAGTIHLMMFIHQTRGTGVLHLISGVDHRAILFIEGEIRNCGSNLISDRLGEILVRQGVVSRTYVARALEETGTERRVGQALVAMGVIGTHDVFAGVRLQVEQIVYAALGLEHGSFFFEHTVPALRMPELGLTTESLLLEGVRRTSQWKEYRREIPSPDVVPIRSPGSVITGALGDECRRVLQLIDGARSVAQIAESSGLGELLATRALHHLVIKGIVEIHDPRTGPAPRRGSEPARPVPRSELVRSIERYGDLLARIRLMLALEGKGQRFFDDLRSFLRGSKKYAALFQGVEPRPDGRLPPDAVIAALERAAYGDPRAALQEAMNELVCFMVFAVGDSIGHSAVQSFDRELAGALETHRASAASS